MKNPIFILGFILSLGMFYSCDNNDQLDVLKDQTMTFDDFFEKVSSMELETNNENVIRIEYEWNKNDNLIKIINFEEEEPSWAMALELSSKNNLKQKGGGYTVSCANGNSSWSKDCDGKWSCGSLIGDCLEEGGCATICEKEMYFAPEPKTFYLTE